MSLAIDQQGSIPRPPSSLVSFLIEFDTISRYTDHFYFVIAKMRNQN